MQVIPWYCKATSASGRCKNNNFSDTYNSTQEKVSEDLDGKKKYILVFRSRYSIHMASASFSLPLTNDGHSEETPQRPSLFVAKHNLTLIVQLSFCQRK